MLNTESERFSERIKKARVEMAYAIHAGRRKRMPKCEMCSQDVEKLKNFGGHKYCLRCSRKAKKNAKKIMRCH